MRDRSGNRTLSIAFIAICGTLAVSQTGWAQIDFLPKGTGIRGYQNQMRQQQSQQNSARANSARSNAGGFGNFGGNNNFNNNFGNNQGWGAHSGGSANGRLFQQQQQQQRNNASQNNRNFGRQNSANNRGYQDNNYSRQNNYNNAQRNNASSARQAAAKQQKLTPQQRIDQLHSQGQSLAKHDWGHKSTKSIPNGKTLFNQAPIKIVPSTRPQEPSTGEVVLGAIAIGIADAIANQPEQYVDENYYYDDGGGYDAGGGFYDSSAPVVQSVRPSQQAVYVESARPVIATTAMAEEAGQPAQPVKPPANRLPNQVTVADRNIGRKIAPELDKLIERKLADVTESLEDRACTDSFREQFMRDNTSAEMDAALVTELKNALIDIDPEATERAAKKLELRGVVLEQLLPRVRLSRTLADLKKLVRNEDSADRVDAFNRNFQGAIREFDLDRSQREDVSLEVENILESLRARLTITEQPTEKPGAMVTAPQGEVLVLFYPPLGPAGKVFLLGSEVLAVGSASTGDLVLGKAEALKVMNVPVSEDTAAETIAAEKASSYVTSGTLVLHRRKYDQPMSYEINDRKYSIKPGESQTLPAGSSWVIAFDKGGKQARYTLGEGSYVFAPKDGGWDLSSKKFEITIENPAMAGQFLLLINEEPLTIPAGKALSLTANYPIIVGFDRGDGGEPAYRRLYDGTYTVAINKADGLWDVFETAATPPTTATEGETASSAAK